MNLLELAVKITADDTGVSESLAATEGAARSTASTLGTKLAKGFKGAAAVGAALVTATAAIGAAVGKAASATAAYGDNVDKMSQKIGISAEAYQKWDYVMQRAGTSVDNLKMGMKTLSAQAEKNSDAFQKLGISQEEVKNSSQEELFQKTIEGLAGMEAGTERTTLATELLGRAGADLGPLLNEGTDAIQEQLEMAEAYGMVMSDEAVAASAAFEDSMTTLNMTMTGLKNRMMGEFLPSMTTVMDGLSLVVIGKTTEGTAKIAEGVEAFVTKIGQTVPRLMTAGGELANALFTTLIDNLPKMLNAGIQMVTTLAGGLAKSLPTLIPKAVQAVTTMATTLVNNGPKIVTAAVKLMAALAQGIIKSIPTVIAAIPGIISGMVRTLVAGVGQLTQVGGQLIQGLWNGIKSKADWVVSMIKGLGTNIINAVKSVFGIHSPSKVFREIGDFIVQGFGEGIEPIGELTNNGTIKMDTAPMQVGGDDSGDMAKMMYEAMSAALDNHVISFNNRELGRLVKSYV